MQTLSAILILQLVASPLCLTIDRRPPSAVSSNVISCRQGRFPSRWSGLRFQPGSTRPDSVQERCARDQLTSGLVNADGLSPQTPFRPDWLALMQFVLFALVTTPPNYKFQTWLERVWPGYHLSPAVEEKAKPRQVQQVKKLNFRNTAIKFALDQLVSTTVNTYIFIVAFALFKGKNVVSACQNEFWPMRKAALKVWPMVGVFASRINAC